jgi:hypothetical protein
MVSWVGLLIVVIETIEFSHSAVLKQTTGETGKIDVLHNAAGNHGGLQARGRRPQVVVGIDVDAMLLCYHCEIQQRRPDFLMLTRLYK